MLSLGRKADEKTYRTGLYYRLSKEDGDKVESDSIVNQRTMIRDYVRTRKEFCIVDEYVDDGYSGSNFERPDFKRLYEDLQSGAVNCVIVKDLSRFGRNYIEVGRYLERLFPLMGVRLIAINDNYDSAEEHRNSDAIIVPIKNLMNDAYCRDMSVKIKTQLEAKRKRGEYVGNFVVYGYCKDARNRNRLVVDEEAAETVKQIFTWKLEGMSDQGIADKLNAIGVASPLEYKLQKGSHISENFKRNERAVWSSKAVFRILHNEIYTGTLLQGKQKKLDYRSKEISAIPRESWARVENTHEAIIDREQFELVQELLQKDTRIAPGKTEVELCSGYVQCGDCGNKMVRHSSTSAGKRYLSYICKTYKADRSCSTHHIRHDRLYGIVLDAVKKQVDLAVNIDRLMQTISDLPVQKRRVVRLDRQMEQLQEEVERFKRIKQNLYEDYAEGVLSRKEYLEYAELYASKIASRQEAMKELSKQRQAALGEQIDSQWIHLFKKHQNITVLTRPVVVELLDKIVVFEDGRVEVCFKYQVVFQEFSDALTLYLADDISCDGQEGTSYAS